ncbi:MAG: CoA synthetase [Gammaproteobacteria bacterium]|nr:CoA synthetase [Gammaproteobacteria bacterium]
MTESNVVDSIDELVARIPDGARLALPKDSAGAPMGAVRALIRRGVRDLHLITVPTSGLATDLLVGAGSVASVETSGVSLGEFGGAPRFNAAVKQGTIAVRDATCPAIYAGLQAAEKGIPFIPLRGVIGSDVLAYRDDWKVIDNPFAPHGKDPLLVLPAIEPEFALFHVRRADRFGNVWIGVNGELAIMAHAAAHTLVTAEEIVDDDLMAEEGTAAGTVPAVYVTAVAQARKGAWPLAFLDQYPADDRHLANYVRAARSAEGFDDYLRHCTESADDT